MQATACTCAGKSFLHISSESKLRQGLRVKKMQERNFINKINSANSQSHRSVSQFNYKRDLNHNFRNKSMNCHTTQLQEEIFTLSFWIMEVQEVNELGWLGPSQLAHFPSKERKVSTLKYASKINQTTCMKIMEISCITWFIKFK